MRTIGYYLIIWALEELLEKFSEFDAAIDRALCNRDKERYIEIIKEKSRILVETANYIFQVGEEKDKEQQRLQEVVCYWSYSAQKFLHSSQITDMGEILTQGGKNRIKFYTKLA